MALSTVRGTDISWRVAASAVDMPGLCSLQP
jgi:hypothetical protein